jgi:hypothetical protein
MSDNERSAKLTALENEKAQLRKSNGCELQRKVAVCWIAKVCRPAGWWREESMTDDANVVLVLLKQRREKSQPKMEPTNPERRAGRDRSQMKNDYVTIRVDVRS